MGNGVTVLAGNGQRAPARHGGYVLEGLDDSLRVAKIIVSSGMAPKSYFTGNADPIAAVWTAMQLGAEIGLSPMASIQNIAVINGKPGLYGTGMLAVVEASGLLQSIAEGVEGEGDARHGWCEVQRRGRDVNRTEFSMADAKRARLAGKTGPWTEYPDRMLLSRARTFALRDNFADVLLGLSHSAEELMDITPEPGQIAPPAPPAPPPASPPPPAPPPSTPRAQSRAPIIVRDSGTFTEFPRSRAGITEALDVIAGGGAALVMENAELLNKIAGMAEFAERVGGIRAAASADLAPADEPEDQEQEQDSVGRAMDVLRGARPADMGEAEASGLPA